MKKILLLAGLACLFSLTANAAETRTTRTYYQRNYQPASYARTTQSRSTQNYQRQQYRQPSYYPQEVQPQPEPDYRYEQAQYAPYDTFRIRPVVGIDYVYSKADIDLKDGDGTDLSELWKDKFNAFAISAGVQLNQYVGLEAFYQQSEKADKTIFEEGGKVVTSDNYKAYGLDVIGYLPIASRLDLIGSLGVAYYKAEVRESWKLWDGESGSVSDSEDKIGFRFGAGLQYYITDYLAFRLMARYNHVNIKGTDDSYKLDNIVDVTAGIRVYF